ncbi:MAG: AEC family transporter [Ruminiclostridium sp.]|nr:AEC family transporter [Ruminiclostridium sp.]
MSDAANAVFQQTIIMFIIVIIGALCYKFRLINDEGKKQLSNFVLYVVNPLLIFMSYQTDMRSELIEGLIWTAIMAALTYTAFILISKLIFPDKADRKAVIERFSVIYSNFGFMGTPLIFGVFGKDGVFIMNGFVTVSNLFIWTHGIITMSGKDTGRHTNIGKSLLMAISTPAVISVFSGLICLFLGIKLPDIVAEAFNNVAEMTTPLAMTVAGASIMSAGILGSLKNPRVYLISAVKLLLFPVIGFALIAFIPCPDMPKLVTLIEFSCPTAAIGTMFAIKFDRDPEYASQLFAVSTLLSLVTLPLIAKAGTTLLEVIHSL